MYLGVSLGVEGLQRTMDYKFIPFGTNIHGIVNPLPHDRFPCSNKALLNPCFWVDFGGQVDQSLNNPTRPSSWSSWHLPIHVLQQHQLRPINKLKDNTTIFIQYEYIYNSWKTHIPYTVYHTCILNFTSKNLNKKHAAINKPWLSLAPPLHTSLGSIVFVASPWNFDRGIQVWLAIFGHWNGLCPRRRWHGGWAGLGCDGILGRLYYGDKYGVTWGPLIDGVTDGVISSRNQWSYGRSYLKLIKTPTCRGRIRHTKKIRWTKRKHISIAKA